MSVLFLKSFVSPEECAQMNAWVNLGVERGWLGMSANRNLEWTYKDRLTTRNYGDQFDYPPIVHAVFARITEALGLQDAPKSVWGGGKDGVVVSCTFPNGSLAPHKDPMEGSLHVLRCNVMTQAADEGSELFIGGEQVNISVGDLHCYLASNVEHYVTQAKGHTPRILWMFGYQVSESRFKDCAAGVP